MKLPIELIPNTTPPKFRWSQVVSTPVGDRVVEHEGTLPTTVEVAIAALCRLETRLATDNMVLRGSINMTVDRLGGVVEGRPTHEGNFLQRIDELVRIEKILSAENESLRQQVQGHCDRIAAQSELLSKKAEASVRRDEHLRGEVASVPPQTIPSKRGK